MSQGHRDDILDQFTRQAKPFSQSPAIVDAAALSLLVEMSGAGLDDTVLDVACGPGIVACAFAGVARHVTGVDITPAMLDRAGERQRELGLTNVTWVEGDVLPLPFPNGEFSVVVSRFAFHHFEEPGAVLEEMVRVCRRGGMVVVADSSPARDKADAFNRMERLRDPSHARALTAAELRALFDEVGLEEPREAAYRSEGELEALLSRSYPAPGDEDRIRRLFAESLEDDTLDMAARREGSTIRYGFPVMVVASRKI